MYKIASIILLMILLVYSCETKNNKDMIEYASKNFEKHEVELNKIIRWINSLDDNESISLELSLNNDSIRIFRSIGEQPQVTLEEDFASFLIKFFDDFGIYRISKFKIGVAFTSDIRNKRFASYSYIWYRQKPDMLYGYEFYEGNEIPKRVSGWMYKIKDNWYLQSLEDSNLN